jgi:hypothetical protein
MQKKHVDFEDGFGWIAQYILAENGAELGCAGRTHALNFLPSFCLFQRPLQNYTLEEHRIGGRTGKSSWIDWYKRKVEQEPSRNAAQKWALVTSKARSRAAPHHLGYLVPSLRIFELS